MIVLALFSFILSFTFLYIIKLYLTEGKLPTGDTFFHLLIIESLKKHQWKYPSSLHNVIFHYDIKPYNYLAYPPLFHYIIALFPSKFLLKIVKYSDLILLSSLSSLVTIATYGYTQNFVVAILSSAITIFNLSTWIRTIGFSSKPLGVLFYSLIFLSTLFAHNLFLIIFISILIALVNLTHKFATQVTTFGMLMYIFLFNEFELLLSIFLGFLLAIIISKGSYLNILKEHYNWLYYFKHNPRKRSLASKLNSIASRNIWYLLLLSVFLTSENQNIFNDVIIAKMFFWALMPLFISILVSFPMLSFFGQEYRYVWYGVVPTGIVASIIMAKPSNHIFVWVVLICTVTSFLILFRLKRYYVKSGFNVSHNDIQDYKSLEKQNIRNLLVFPHTRALEINYFTGAKVVCLVRTTPLTPNYFKNLLDRYDIRYALRFKKEDRAFSLLKKAVDTKKLLDFQNFEIYQLNR